MSRGEPDTQLTVSSQVQQLRLGEDAASAAVPRPDAGAAAEQWRALVPALAARGKMRLSLDGGRNYPRQRGERALSAEPPSCPAAVYVYDDHGESRLLAGDFDTKLAGGRGALDPAGQVTADAAALAALIRRCGGQSIGDRSPSGGRHQYVLWAAPVAFAEMRRVILALARRYPSLDPSPMLGVRNGLIRPPGSWHRGGHGRQLLTGPLNAARRCVQEPCGPLVWARLCAELAGELEAVDRGDSPAPPAGGEAAPAEAQWRRDDAGAPWLHRQSGWVPRLRPDLELTAITGAFDSTRRTPAGKPWTTSEARFAVLGSAAARGWRLAQVAERMRSGAWGGLAGFYDQYPQGRQRTKALASDWKKAVGKAYGENSGRLSNTSENHHGGGGSSVVAPASGGPADPGAYPEIHRWESAFRSCEIRRWPGPHGITLRMVIRALGGAAQMTGSTVIEFGTRSLALLAGLDHTTVARALQELRDESDPFIELLDSALDPASRRSKAQGDLYLLLVPESCAEAAAWRRWRPGLLGVHPVFRLLGGGPAALVCEQLADQPVRTTDLPLLTGLSATAVSSALAGLAAHGIAVRGPGGWRRGPAALDDVADQLGVPEILARIQVSYQDERQIWHARLMIVTPPPLPSAEDDDVPLPEVPMNDDEYGELAVGRAPPGVDDTAIATLEAALGPVRVITTAA